MCGTGADTGRKKGHEVTTNLQDLKNNEEQSQRGHQFMKIARHFLIGVAAATLLAGCAPQSESAPEPDARLMDSSDGDDWAAYGATYGEQHFSALSDINAENIGELGLAWAYDLPPGNPMSGPIAVNGVLYTATGYSVVRAFNPETGEELWSYDPKAPEKAGKKLREGWGIRGLSWWNGKIIVGTHDGRLIALDDQTGKELWSTLTVEPDDLRFISSAPRVFAGKVIIGHGGADAAATRGYVTAYDADTGKELWRFYTVPGNPADGFEDETQEMAAKTWTGEWWKHGGGGTVWNTFTYDKKTETIFLGTGNGAPWNQRIRSPDGGDNLFLCSIVALDARTGKYKWHYQINPGETWDYNASMDMHLATLKIDGKQRKVIMQAPKNGFLYVIDRLNGKLISAEPIAEVSWAEKIDLETGRPVEHPLARYPDGETFDLWPGPNGAHTWLPSAYSPATRLVYLPVSEMGWSYNDEGIDHANWSFSGNNEVQSGVNVADIANNGSRLVAWDPVTQKERWRSDTPGAWTGGIMATGGNLVFQGNAGNQFAAYHAETGEKLWSFDAGVPVLAPPITYRAGGRQYVTVIAGVGTSAGILEAKLAGQVDYRTQQRRVLTFVIGGKASLPATKPEMSPVVADQSFRANAESAARGGALYVHCFVCHGPVGGSGGSAPDFSTSVVPQSADTFSQIVREGGLIPMGMPNFSEFTDQQLDDLRQYLRTETARVRKEGRGGGHSLGQ